VSSPAASASAKPVAPKQARASFPGLGWLKRNDKADAKGSPRSYIFDLTALQLAALVYVFALIGLAIGIAATNASVNVLTTMGYGPFAKHVRVRPPRLARSFLWLFRQPRELQINRLDCRPGNLSFT
jgi:hypothetical protein